jgi:catechol 2,3-dioxygenase-like lactoylglutathione lyase family enzyme
MNAKIRHCAIWSDGYERSARFYETIFGMRFFTTQGAAERDPSNRSRGQLSDGIIGLALNPRPPGYRSGLDHFGFQLQDLDKVREKIKQDYPDTIFTKGLEGVAFAGLRITDPVGTHIDIAQEGGANLRGGYSRDEGWEQPRHLHHIAIRAVKPGLLAEFYQKVFELTEVKNLSTGGGICLTDGKSYLLIRPCENYSYRSMTQGLDHVGFEVEDLEAVKRELDDLGRSFPESAPRKIFVGRNGALLQRDIDSCSLGQYAIADPDGVLIDLTT